MSNIRRQSIISSAIVYFGFALGFVNTYLFTRENSFTPEQYGLIGAFIAIGNVMFSFSILGMQSYVYKFYPYYNDNLKPKENDLISWALVTTLTGFALVAIAGFFLKDLVIKKYITNAPDIVRFYYWLFPFGLGLTLFTLLEAYSWQLRHSVMTNFLREVFFRVLQTVLIVFFFAKIISSYSSFIKIYAFAYLFITLVLLGFLISRKEIHFTLNPSRVTKKFFKKIVTLASFVWSGSLVYNISTVFDTLVIAAVLPNGLAYAAIYSLAQNIASLIQAPQRGIISASVAPLSKAWKDKDFEKINRIYHRSSINQLIFSVGMFSLIWLNFADGVETFSLKDTYIQALPVFLFIGLMRILDMGTGLNAQIIGTSTYWRFEFFTGIILLAMALPLNYILTKKIGVTGPAISNLIAFTIYNAIRFNFLYRKFGMQPFTWRSLIAIVLGAAAYAICYYLFRSHSGFLWIMIRSICFTILYGGGVLFLQLSPDILPVLGSIGKKVRLKR